MTFNNAKSVDIYSIPYACGGEKKEVSCSLYDEGKFKKCHKPKAVERSVMTS